MRTGEVAALEAAFGSAVVEVRPLAGGFSHETCLVALADGDLVVVRLGGPDPAIEAAVMARARALVPVPEVLCVVPAASEDIRPAMVLEYVAGTPLGDVLGATGTAWRSSAPRSGGSSSARDKRWAYLGHVLDMFALSDLVTRPPGHPVADQAAELIRRWVAEGAPGA
jgi:hypothetical protein